MVGFNAYYDNGFKHGSTGPAGYLAFGQGTSGAFTFATAPSGLADAAATMTTRMTILNDGKVGIGDTTPTHTLDVAGTINATGIISTPMYVDADWGTFSTSTAGFTALFATSTGTGTTVGLERRSAREGKAITGTWVGPR